MELSKFLPTDINAVHLFPICCSCVFMQNEDKRKTSKKN